MTQRCIATKYPEKRRCRNHAVTGPTKLCAAHLRALHARKLPIPRLTAHSKPIPIAPHHSRAQARRIIDYNSRLARVTMDRVKGQLFKEYRHLYQTYLLILKRIDETEFREVIRTVEVPREVIRTVEVPREVIRYRDREVIKEVPREVIKEVPYEVIKEVPREVIKQVIKQVPKIPAATTQQINMLIGKQQTLNAEVARLTQELQQCQTASAQVQQELSQCRQETEVCQRQLQSLANTSSSSTNTAQINALQNEVKTKSSRISSLETELKQKMTEINSLTAQLAANPGDNSDLRIELKKREDDVRTCGDELKKREEDLKTCRNELKNREGDVNTCQRDLDTIKTEKDGLETELLNRRTVYAENEFLKKTNAQLTRKLTTLTTAYNEMKNEKMSAVSQNIVKNAEIKAVTTQKDAYYAEQTKLQRELSECRGKIQQLEDDLNFEKTMKEGNNVLKKIENYEDDVDQIFVEDDKNENSSESVEEGMRRLLREKNKELEATNYALEQELKNERINHATSISDRNNIIRQLSGEIAVAESQNKLMIDTFNRVQSKIPGTPINYSSLGTFATTRFTPDDNAAFEPPATDEKSAESFYSSTSSSPEARQTKAATVDVQNRVSTLKNTLNNLKIQPGGRRPVSSSSQSSSSSSSSDAQSSVSDQSFVDQSLPLTHLNRIRVKDKRRLPRTRKIFRPKRNG